MTYDNWKTRSPDDDMGVDPRECNFVCDGCYAEFPDDQAVEVDGPGGWTMCAHCAEKHNNSEELANCVWRGAEFPFADNH